MKKTITTFKAFDKNLQCRGFQYEIGKKYSCDGVIKACENGFHAFENPFDVLSYYDLVGSKFAKVEQSGEIDSEDNKIASEKIKIKGELSFSAFIGACVKFCIEKTKISDKNNSSGYSAKIGSSSDYVNIGSSSDYVNIGSSGDSAKIGSSGNYVQIGSSSDYAKICSSGNYAKICSSGNYVKIGSSGYSAKIGSSGDYVKICSSGDSAKIDSSGNCAVVAAIGIDSIAKAKSGSWITLAEYGNNCKPVCVKAEQVDGARIKADVFYKLVNGEFVEA